MDELSSIALELLRSKEYLFWLDWILRLSPHFYDTENQPTDPIHKDQKCWSHLTVLCRFGIRRDATNLTYFFCMAMLAHMMENVPDSWSRFTACRLSHPIKNGYCEVV